MTRAGGSSSRSAQHSEIVLTCQFPAIGTRRQALCSICRLTTWVRSGAADKPEIVLGEQQSARFAVIFFFASLRCRQQPARIVGEWSLTHMEADCFVRIELAPAPDPTRKDPECPAAARPGK